MKPTECPLCEMWAFRHGVCGHCGHEEDREWRPTPKPQVELGRKKIDEAREIVRKAAEAKNAAVPPTTKDENE